MPRTISEQIFETFCAAEGIICERVPEAENRTPDYELVFGPIRVVVEVKEIGLNPDEEESERLCRERGYGIVTGGKPGERVRKKIADSSGQIKARTNGTNPSMLVLLNSRGHAGAYNIRVAMYGLEQIHIAVPPLGTGSPYAVGVGHGPGRKMTSDCNTSISAIGVLDMSGPDQVHFHVYHNCHARVPLDPGLFAGHAVTQFEIGDPVTSGASAWHEMGSTSPNTQMEPTRR